MTRNNFVSFESPSLLAEPPQASLLCCSVAWLMFGGVVIIIFFFCIVSICVDCTFTYFTVSDSCVVSIVLVYNNI